MKGVIYKEANRILNAKQEKVLEKPAMQRKEQAKKQLLGTGGKALYTPSGILRLAPGGFTPFSSD